MQCDRCNEQYSTEWYRVYRHDNYKEVYICTHCMYEEFLREKDEARKEYLKSLMETLSSLKPKPKPSFLERLFCRNGDK